MLVEDVRIRCPACYERQWIEIDLSEGESQELIQDCEICCRPLQIVAVREGDRFRAQAQLCDG